jgi:hypothetical protein
MLSVPAHTFLISRDEHHPETPPVHEGHITAVQDYHHASPEQLVNESLLFSQPRPSPHARP